MRLDEFLTRRAVFTVEEVDRYLPERGSGNAQTRKSLLAYHRRRGRIVRVRRCAPAWPRYRGSRFAPPPCEEASIPDCHAR